MDLNELSQYLKRSFDSPFIADADKAVRTLMRVQHRLRGMAETPTDKDCVAFVDSLRQVLTSAGLDTSPLPAWTVFVRQANGEGTTWVQAYRAETVEQAKEDAMADARQAWELDDVEVLGVAEGDVRVVEWSD